MPTPDLVAWHVGGQQGTLEGSRACWRGQTQTCWQGILQGMLEGRDRPGGRAFWLCSGGRSSAQSPPPGRPHHWLQGRAPGGTWPDTHEGTWAGPYDRACHSTAAPPSQLQMPAGAETAQIACTACGFGLADEESRIRAVMQIQRCKLLLLLLQQNCGSNDCLDMLAELCYVSCIQYV